MKKMNGIFTSVTGLFHFHSVGFPKIDLPQTHTICCVGLIGQKEQCFNRVIILIPFTDINLNSNKLHTSASISISFDPSLNAVSILNNLKRSSTKKHYYFLLSSTDWPAHTDKHAPHLT